MSGTVVEVLARLKADAGNFVRGTTAARDSAKRMAREANEASATLTALGREVKKTGRHAVVTAGEVEVLDRAMSGMKRKSAEARAVMGALGRQIEETGADAIISAGEIEVLNLSLGQMRNKSAEAAAAQGGLNMQMLKWGGIGAGVLAAAPQLMSFLQQLSGVFALLPALAGAGAVSLATLGIGLSGVMNAVKNSGDPEKFAAALKNLSPAAQSAAKAIAALAPELRGFRNLVQQSLFVGMTDNIKAFGGFLPKIAGGFQAVATAINHVVTDLTKFWTSAKGVGIWNALLQGTAQMLERMRGGFVALSDAIGTITAVGASMLGGLGGGFTKTMQRFDEFIQKVAADGSLKRFMQGGLDAIHGLISVIKSLGMIWGGITSAIRTAQGGLSSGFAGLLRSAAQWVQSAKGQKVLVAIFSEVHKAVVAIGNAIVAAVAAFKLIAPVVLPIIGVIVRLAEEVLKHKKIVVALIAAWMVLDGPIGLILVLASAIKYAYDHCETFRRIVLEVAAAIVFGVAIGIKAYRMFANLVLTYYAAIATGAAKAFGWIPGLGGGLKAAAAAMSAFKDTALAALDAAADKAMGLAAALDEAARPRVAYIDIVTRQIKEGDTPLHTGQHTSGNTASNNPYGLGKGKYNLPQTPPKKIPGVGGSGFGKTGSGSAPLKALPPVLANIPVINDSAHLAKMMQTLTAVIGRAGKAITLSYVSPLNAAKAAVTAAGAAAAAAQQHFAYTVSAAAGADRKAAQARAAYLAEHNKTVAMLKASNGKMTDAIKLQERAEAAAKKTAEAAAAAAKKGGAAAVAAYNAAAAAAATLAQAQQALAQVNYDAMKDKAQKALDAISAAVDAVKAKIASLVQAFANGVNQAANLGSNYSTIYDSLQSQADAAMQAQQQATENLTKAQQDLAAAQQAVLDTDPTAQAKNNVVALKSAADLAKNLGTSIDKIVDIHDVPDSAQQAARAQLSAAQQAVALASQAATNAAAAAAAATAAFDPSNIAKQVQDALTNTLNQANAFLGDLTNLQSMGASDALVQQIAEMGPVAGDAFAKALLAAGKPAIVQMNATLAGIDKVTTDGITRLANHMYSPMLDATTKALQAMKSQFALVFGEIADEVTALMAQISGVTGVKAASTRLAPSSRTPITRTAGGVRLARGGIVTSPMHPLIGEAGPEAVMPLTALKGLLGGGIGGGLNVGDIDIKVTVPATATGVTAEDVAAAVNKGVTEALSSLRRALVNT